MQYPHPNENITIHPRPNGFVEVYFKENLREVWQPWGSLRICRLLREQTEPDPENRFFALGDHPAFKAWRESFPPLILDLAKTYPKKEITVLELANREPVGVFRLARVRPGILWWMCGEVEHPSGRSVEEIAEIAALPLAKILSTLNCSEYRPALRIIEKWPPQLRENVNVESFLLSTINKRKQRIARHYTGQWNRDVILCLSLPEHVVSDQLLHLSSQCSEDESAYAASREILSDLGHWPFSTLPKSYPRFLTAIERQYERQFRDEAFPLPILPAPAWASAIESPRELRKVATNFQNCIFTYLECIRSGNASAYFSERPDPELVWVVTFGDGILELGDVVAKNNERPEECDFEAVVRWFQNGGIS